uniref:Uncharacterized protein n=1 Tax=Acrobeloides nanus TaxID=290746 RepID=A0A914CIK7_9BILA
MKSFLICLLFVNFWTSYAGIGIDSKKKLDLIQWICLGDANFEMMFAQVYETAGQVDENGILNLLAEDFDGSMQMSAYIAPCVSGKCLNGINDAAGQVNATLQNLKQKVSDFEGYVFIEVATYQNWSSNKAQNQQFIVEMVNSLHFANSFMGIITGQSAWTSIFGASFTNASVFAQDLVWVNWNGVEDLTTGWTPFGGWTQPVAHQYAGNINNNNCTIGKPINYVYFDSESDFGKRMKKTKVDEKRQKVHKFDRN